MHIILFVFLIALSFAAKQNKNVAVNDGHQAENVNENGEKNQILVKIEEDEYAKKKETSSQFIGVSYNVKKSKWQARRHSKLEKKTIHNGGYDNEETAAHASDTLARKLMTNGEQSHKLNFPDDDIDVFAEKKKENSSQYIGVSYSVKTGKCSAQRYSKLEEKQLYNGYYDNEEKAARASDTLAKKLRSNGEKSHKLNFPDDDTKVFQEKKTTSSQYIGVHYNVNNSKWLTYRRSKHEKKMINNGYYDNEETAAHASDTLARKLMANGEQLHRLNFPDDDTEVLSEKKTTSSQYIGVSYHVKKSKWQVRRHSKHQKNIIHNGQYDDEKIAAHASDTLARKLMENGEQPHKLNFPDDYTKVFPEEVTRKRKRLNHEDVSHPKDN